MDFFVSELEKLNELGKIREGLNSYKYSVNILNESVRMISGFTRFHNSNSSVG